MDADLAGEADAVCSKGIGGATAYREAGFAGGGGNAGKLAAKPAVAARIAELTEPRNLADRASLPHTVVDLMAWSDKRAALNTPASPKGARPARLDAGRLRGELGGGGRVEPVSRAGADRVTVDGALR